MCAHVNLQASCQFCSERDAHKQALFPGQPPRVRHGLLGATMTVLTVDDHGVQDFRYEPCPTPWILCLRGTPPEITGLSASPTHMILTPSSSLEFDAFFDLAKPGLTSGVHSSLTIPRHTNLGEEAAGCLVGAMSHSRSIV